MADDLFDDIPVESADLFADIPVPKGRPGVRAALADIMSNRRRGSKPNISVSTERDFGDVAAENFTLGLTNLSNAGIGAAITGLQRAVPGGKQPKYTAADYFDATRLYQDAQRRAFAAKHPVQNVSASILGALGMPGGAKAGEFVIGKTAPKLAAAGAKVPAAVRAGQTARAATVGGALTGAQSAATARPGEEVDEAKRGALTGAVLTPVAGAAAGVVVKAAPKVVRAAKTLVGKGPGAEITSVEKLQKALRQAGVTPDAIEAASREWAEMGGVTPALLDIVKDAGGSSEVLRLLGRSVAKAPVRRLADDYAEETVGGVQAKALDQVRALPTGGESRTPTQVRADLDAERAAVDADLAAATREPPAAPRARESGAAQFADELNKLYDASEKGYRQAYAAAEAAKPEAAVVDDAEVRPLFERMRGALRGLNPDLEGVSAVSRYLEKAKGEIAPGEAADWPEGEVMELAGPLTVQKLEFIRQKMVELAEKHAGATGGAAASRVKQVVDDELRRLSAEGKFQGDPDVVQKWTDAIQGYAEHQKKFGSGLPAKLTERKPDGSRAVPAHMAGDVVFGSPTQGSLNRSLNELGDSLDLVSPQSVRALQEELYGRVKLEDLAKLRETTGGKRLLPEDLSQEAMRVPEQNVAAEEIAGARREPIEAKETALRLGEDVLGLPSEEFEPALGAVENVNLPLTASGARQAVMDVVEKPAPGSTGVLNTLLGARASKNLGLAVSPADVARMQQRIKAIQRQARGAQELQAATGQSALKTDPLIETVTAGDIAYRERGLADMLVKTLRRSARLSEREYEAALKTLTSKDPEAKSRLLKGLLEKYPAAKRALSPFLMRPAAQSESDPEAVETLEEDYGVR